MCVTEKQRRERERERESKKERKKERKEGRKKVRLTETNHVRPSGGSNLYVAPQRVKDKRLLITVFSPHVSNQT